MLHMRPDRSSKLSLPAKQAATYRNQGHGKQWTSAVGARKPPGEGDEGNADPSLEEQQKSLVEELTNIGRYGNLGLRHFQEFRTTNAIAKVHRQ